MSDFYSVSGGITNLIKLVKPMVETWAYRYKHIVDNSERGLECPYAQRAARFSFEEAEPEKLLEMLKALEVQTQALISYYSTLLTDEDDNEDLDY